MSQERVSGFPEKGADLRGSPGTSGEVWETSGEVWETSGEPLDCCLVPEWQNLRGSRRKISGEVRGTSGEVGGLPTSSGEPDSLPATRQICLQIILFSCVLPIRTSPRWNHGGYPAFSWFSQSWQYFQHICWRVQKHSDRWRVLEGVS